MQKNRGLGVKVNEFAPTDIPKGLTLAKVQETYQKYLRQWTESLCCSQLRQLLKREVLSLEHVHVTQCVCLGLGSCTGAVGGYAEHAWWQLCALRTLLEGLRRFSPITHKALESPIRGLRDIGSRHPVTEIVMQDPRFNALDEELLAALGFTVVKDPEAFRKIGETTFLYVPHGELEVTGRALQGQEPALYVGNDLDMWIESPAVDEEKKKMVLPWREKSVSVGMPQPEAGSWYNNTRIYWKRPTSEDRADD